MLIVHKLFFTFAIFWLLEMGLRQEIEEVMRKAEDNWKSLLFLVIVVIPPVGAIATGFYSILDFIWSM